MSETLRLRGGERYEIRDDEQSPPKKTPREATALRGEEEQRSGAKNPRSAKRKGGSERSVVCSDEWWSVLDSNQ